jgi:hypothetical protein
MYMNSNTMKDIKYAEVKLGIRNNTASTHRIKSSLYLKNKGGLAFISDQSVSTLPATELYL